MAQKRLSMRKIRDVLRLKYGLGRSHREIAAILRISHSTVGSYVRRAREAGVSWPLPDELDDRRLEAALYPPTPPSRVRRPEPDWARVHRELARHKGVTLQLLWLEYREAHPDGYQYSRFCDRYREWRGHLDVVLRQVYRAGEKAFVDYAGSTVDVTDRRTGEVQDAKVFVGVLAASNHTFVDVTLTRSLRIVRVLGRSTGARHPGQREGGGATGKPLRTRRQPDIPRPGGPLRDGGAARPAEIAAGQGEGGGGGPERGAVGSGTVTQPPVLLAFGGPRGDRAPAGGAQRAAVPEDRGQPPQSLRGSGPSGAQAAPGRSLRVCQVAQGPREHRLPHPGRRPLLQRPPRACPLGGRGPARHDHDRDLPQAPACGGPTSAAAGRADIPPIRAICPPPTAPTSNGPRRASSAGRERPGPRPRPSRGSSSRPGATRSRATAAASASCASPAPIPPNGWKPPAAARWTSAPTATSP